MAQLSWTGIMGLIWGFAAVNTLLTVGRYAIRYKVKQRFHWDDLAHLIAVLCLIGTTGIAQVLFAPAPAVSTIVLPTPDAAAAETKSRQLQGASILMGFACLWAVKFAFLLFYYMLFWVSDGFRKAFWAVMLFVSLGYLAPLIGYWPPIGEDLMYCGEAEYMYIKPCTEAQIKSQGKTLIYICAIHVATDFAVMILPLFMLRKIRIKIHQKLGVALLFSIGLVTIALDILRTVYGLQHKNGALYSVLEMNVAVTISCVLTYRGLFGIRERIRMNGHACWYRNRQNHGSKARRRRFSEKVASTWKRTSKSTDEDPIKQDRSSPLEMNLMTDGKLETYRLEPLNTHGLLDP